MWLFQKREGNARASTPAQLEPEGSAEYGHYRILRRENGHLWELGHGAMGITYKAEDVNLRVPVALKIISPLIADQPDAREFFLTEARGAASLRHRNAASVHHLGVTRAGELFFVMEFIEGETVDVLIRRQHRLGVSFALDIAQQTACALAAAGQRSLVHRDLKPANLMLSDEGDGAIVVKVIDFGLCKQLPSSGGLRDFQDRPAESRHGGDSANGFLGTPHYASPEQIRGDATLDQRADFYSLGATLWTMLAGRPIFHGPLAQVRQRHLEEPPPFHELPGDVSPPVHALLSDLLHKEPAKRPKTPLELIDRIEGAAYDHRGTAADPRRHWRTQGCVPLLGSVLAHNYHLEALAEGSSGTDGNPVFRAEDIAGQRRVAVQLLDRSQPLEALRGALDRLAAAPHPNLLRNHVFSSCRGQPFLVDEWTNGFSLRDVLLARARTLGAAEVRMFVAQTASALEHAQANGLGALDTRAAAVQVHFTASEPDEVERRRLLTRPVAEWPAFSLKLRLLVVPDGMASAYDAVRMLGQLAAEMLGGGTVVGGKPVEQFAEDNAASFSAIQRIIRRAISAPGDFESVSEFASALAAASRADGAQG